MQKELAETHPGLQIQFIAINGWGHESGNSRASNGRDVPLLQDVDENDDFSSDVWASWDVEYRDVIIVDAQGEIVDSYNLTFHDLSRPNNYDELKEIVLETAAANPVLGDCNLDGSVNAADLDCVRDLEERDQLLESLNTLPGDLNGDGEVAFSDFLILSANYGTDIPHYALGNIDMQGGVDFADFLIMSSHFGRRPSLASSPDNDSVDAVFAS